MTRLLVLRGQRSNLFALVSALTTGSTVPPNGSPTADHDAELLSAPTAPAGRQKHRRLGEPERTDLAEAYRAGTSRRDLAARYDINPTTVDAILTRASVERRRVKITADEVTLAAVLYERQHLSCAGIGQRLGYNATTIWNALRTRGVRLRDTAGLDR